jgi:hypothetical protein
LIRLDLGLSTLPQLANHTQTIQCESGLTYAKPHPDRPSYLVKSFIQERTQPGYLLDLLSNINKDVMTSQGTQAFIELSEKIRGRASRAGDCWSRGLRPSACSPNSRGTRKPIWNPL